MGAASSVPGQPVLGAELRGEGSGCLHVPTGQMGQKTVGPAWEAARKEAEAAVAGRGGSNFKNNFYTSFFKMKNQGSAR